MIQPRARSIGAAAAIVVVGLLGGCAGAPTYDDVRADTISAGEEIIATFTQAADVEQSPDGTPYGCSSGGYMYTGQWTVTFAEGTDIAALINALPDALGEEWTVTPGSLPRSDEFVDITDSRRQIGVSVSDYSASYEAPTVDVLATSVCATMPSSGSEHVRARGRRAVSSRHASQAPGDCTRVRGARLPSIATSMIPGSTPSACRTTDANRPAAQTCTSR